MSSFRVYRRPDVGAYGRTDELAEFSARQNENDVSPGKGTHQMEMEYGPFGVANLIVDAYGSFAVAWRIAGGGEKLLWILLLAVLPATAYAAWLMTGQSDDRAFG